MLERIGVSLEEDLLARFDGLIAERGYVNRSEAIRDLIRDALVQREWRESQGSDERVGVAVLVYDPDARGVARKLAHVQHEHRRAVVSSLHVHVDAHRCLEVIVLRGPAADVVRMGEGLASAKGVVYGKVVPATTGAALR
jgi:CopG family nickel-responsive transcriptional regulator